MVQVSLEVLDRCLVLEKSKRRLLWRRRKGFLHPSHAARAREGKHHGTYKIHSEQRLTCARCAMATMLQSNDETKVHMGN